MKTIYYRLLRTLAIVGLLQESIECQRINIIEWLWRNNPFVASLDLGLMAIGGKIRSEQEFKDLFAASEIAYTTTQALGPGIFAACGTPKSQLQNQASHSTRK